MRKTVVPRSDRRLAMCSHRLLRLCGSRPVVGSSRKTSGGWCSSPSAISRRRRCPPDSVLTSRCSSPVSSSWSGQQFRALPRLSPADAVQRGLVQQLLDDQAGRVGAAHRLADGLRHVADLLAHLERARQQVGTCHRGRPRGRLEQRSQHAQRGGLARAVRPEEADDLALADGKVHAPDRLDRALAALEGPGEPSCLDNRHGSVPSLACPPSRTSVVNRRAHVK